MQTQSFYLPDVGRNSSILLVLLVGQILATAFWLITDDVLSIDSLGLISAYVMVANTVLCLCLSLCRPYMLNKRRFIGAAFFLAITLIVYSLVEIASQWLLAPDAELDWVRIISVIGAVFLVSLIIIRFTAILHIVNTRTQAESESRVLALQARIQPHFLFNCLNTISELIIVAPKEAEEAVESLSLLFRASLEDDLKEHSLDQELELCDHYIELERWRFEDSLRVTKNVLVKESSAIFVPKLILQPLLENAIKYGMTVDGSIEVKLDVRETSSDVSVLLENSLSLHPHQTQGHGIAMANVKERLQLLYDDQHVIKIKQSKESFSVLMRIPKRAASS